MEISEKQITKDQSGITVSSEDAIKAQSVKYTTATLAKLPKMKLQQLLTNGQITRKQYEKALKKPDNSLH